MKHLKQWILGVVVLASIAPLASAGMYITEWMYDGNASGQEYIEFTNVGAAPIDMTGWSFDDDSRNPGTVNLSAFGLVQPGQSVILAEADAATFADEWSLVGATSIGENGTNLGRADEINLFDAAGTLVDRLTYGDQAIPGTIRTKGTSGNPTAPAALGANDVAQWTLSAVGDAFGSFVSNSGNIGNPGTFVPEPAAFAPLGLLALLTLRRR